jgi:hypothetical protein
MLFLHTGCISVKPTGQKSAKKLYESFFVGEEGLQYFIKPLDFNAQATDILLLDITFRYKNAIRDTTFVNFSFVDKAVINKVDSLRITNNSDTIVLKKMQKLFVERNKKGFRSRYTSRVLLSDITMLFKDSNWQLTLYGEAKTTVYTAPKGTKKNIDKLEFEIFSLFSK